MSVRPRAHVVAHGAALDGPPAPVLRKRRGQLQRRRQRRRRRSALAHHLRARLGIGELAAGLRLDARALLRALPRERVLALLRAAPTSVAAVTGMLARRPERPQKGRAVDNTYLL
jgi:hypothetical protein